MSRLAPLLILVAAAALLAGGGAAYARGGGGSGGFGAAGPDARFRSFPDTFVTDEYDDIRRMRQRGDILPLETILERARRQRPGRVLETALEREHGRYLYSIEMLDDDGRVWELELDAVTGDLLEDRRED